MTYYSHSKAGQYTKTLAAHTDGVRTRALRSLYEAVDFGFADAVPPTQIVQWLTGLHDLGKLTPFFQQYLIDRYTGPPDRKTHALIGALVAWYALEASNETVAFLVAYLIAHHHRSLAQPSSNTSPLQYAEDWEEISERIDAQRSRLPPAREMATVLGTPPLGEALAQLVTLPDLEDLAEDYQCRNRRGPRGLETFLGTNYYFSLLVEADKLDASDTPLVERCSWPPTAVSDYLRPLGPAREGLNLLRNEARNAVRATLDRIDLHEQRLFTLTAPTGLGKTLTALDFALGLADRLSTARAGRRPQLIVALPFISIIEQTLSEYAKVFAERDLRVVGHYQFADVTADRDLDDNAREELGTEAYQRARMQLDTWQADVVVTSFVQLFGSIVTGRNAALKKFNHLAGSILLLDEVQSVRAELLPFIGSLLHYLTRCLDVRIVAMTATKPLLFEQGAKLLAKLGVPHRPAPLELLTDHETYFRRFERTRLVIAAPAESIDTPTAFVAYFSARWKADDCALVVVNTVNRSLELFGALREAYAERADLFYLSTNVLPVDRERRIAVVREAIDAFRTGQGTRPVILVSTQVVEAGVDLDFDIGFRDRAPVPSLIQVAGRLNRNQRAGRTGAPLYVFNYHTNGRPDAVRIYGSVTLAAVEAALAERVEIPESDYLGLCERYFAAADSEVYGYSRCCFEACEVLRYHELEDYALIGKDERVRPVFIALPGAGAKALTAYQSLQAGNYPDREAYYAAKNAFERDFGTAFRKHILNVPQQYATDLDALTDFLWLVPEDEVANRYDPTTGWIRAIEELNTLLLL